MGIDAKKIGDHKWTVFINGARVDMHLDLIDWVKQCEQLGAGEICLNSIDADGTKEGFDLPMLKAVCDAVSIPVIAKPNAGMPQIDDLGNAVYSMTPADFAGYMKVLVDNGASVIGGCCGTTPEFISETAQVLGLR